jgi:hypothetical protein
MVVENLEQHRNERSSGELKQGHLKEGHEGGGVMAYSFPRRSLGRRSNEPEPINWRRGMYRVWLLVSAAWIMSWIIYLILYGLRAGFQGTGDVLVIPILLFGPPVAMLLFGMAAGWAFRGFNIEESKPTAE